MPHIIDTHTFLWFVDGAAELPASVRHLIDNPADATQISIASFWEIGIKASIGKLPLTTNLLGLEAIAARQSIEILPITVQAIFAVQQMPLHHKYPFDRIIAATVLRMCIKSRSRPPSPQSWGNRRGSQLPLAPPELGGGGRSYAFLYTLLRRAAYC